MGRMTNNSFMTGIKNWVLGKIANIMALIPNQASASNQLADKNFVNSSIATATATFRGTYNVVSDLSLSYNATHAQIEAALATKMVALSIVADNNDYAFVQIPTSDATPTEIAKIEKYKYNGSVWAFEYELNNSGFTAAQWAAINSGATLDLIGKLSALPTNAELTTILNGKALKVVNATAGHFAGLDASGNPTDSGLGLEDNGAYDVTAHNNNVKFASLSELLNSVNLNTLIPVAVRKGGMSIKFVCSSDNKYVQYRFILSTFALVQFTDPANWQGIDEEPTDGSKNTVESGGTYRGIRKVGDVVNGSLMKVNKLAAFTTLNNGYPRTDGAFYSINNHTSKVYDVSGLKKVYINGICSDSDTGIQYIALIAFSSDQTFASYTGGFLRQPAKSQELINYEVTVPEHTGTLYACVLSEISEAEMFDLSTFDSYINVDNEIEELKNDVNEVENSLDDINDELSVLSELQGTLIVGYPRTNGRMSGDLYRSKVYNVSNIDKIYVSGTITSPNVVLLAAFSTDSAFASFTHGTVTQPTDVETIVNYEVQVPVHSGTLYVCIPFATTVDYVEVGGNVFTSVKSKQLFIPQEFDTRLKNDEDRISALENQASPKIIINCVGDSITQGQKGILNLRDGTVDSWNRYPYYLQQLLGTNYNIKNYGYGGNSSMEIFTSVGWEGVVINQDIVLQGDKTPASINDINPLTDTFRNQNVANYLNQFKTTEAETAQTKCSVFGIPCNLSRSNDVLYIARQDAVSYDTTIPSGTMLCFDGIIDKEAVSVIFTGENNFSFYIQNNGADFVDYMKNIVLQISNGKYIIVGLHVAATQLSDINSIKTANNALRKEFGNRFIDLQKELSSYAIFQQLDYTPTNDSFFTAEQLAGGVYSDEGAIALGIQPSSFWRQVKGIADYTANDSIHMSGLGYNALAILISNRLKTLGWVTE